jgi:hypothetical protein
VIYRNRNSIITGMLDILGVFVYWYGPLRTGTGTVRSTTSGSSRTSATLWTYCWIVPHRATFIERSDPNSTNKRMLLVPVRTGPYQWSKTPNGQHDIFVKFYSRETFSISLSAFTCLAQKRKYDAIYNLLSHSSKNWKSNPKVECERGFKAHYGLP